MINDIRDTLHALGYDTIVSKCDELITMKDGYTHNIPLVNITSLIEDNALNMSIIDIVSIIKAFHDSKQL
jgi:hypothetical protein